MAGKATDMSALDLQQVAQVLKSNGTDGELVMGFREIAPEDIDLQEPVFIIFDGLPVPFFIESFSKRGNTKALVHLTGISSMEDVEEIAGKVVYVAADELPEMSLEEDGYAALVGWMVLSPEMPEQDGHDGQVETDETDEDASLPALTGNLYEVGQITDFMDIPNNPCIEVETENGAVILPLHEDFIIAIDPEYQEIVLQIPEGLL